MTHGEKLTEYTSFELQVLLDAIKAGFAELYDARELGYVNGVDYEQYVNAMDQWKTKVIEAKAEVRVREINTTEN